MRIMVTGGAGFIGSHLCDHLLGLGHEVMAYDILVPQVHGGDGLQTRPGSAFPDWPTYMDPRVSQWVGDVGNCVEVLRALEQYQPDVVVHLAAYVGVAQSWTSPAAYLYAPAVTASLYEAIRAYNTTRPGDGVKRVFYAGSMSCYGEGPTMDDAIPFGVGDSDDSPAPCPEEWPLDPQNPYALGKAEGEKVALMLGAQMGIETVVGRFFNVLGSRQALSNPYTGIVAIWAAALLSGAPPMVFEDGEQSRDFVHVSDVARAILTIVEQGEPGTIYNVGRGERVRILDVAWKLCALHGEGYAPEVTGITRAGDIKHCYADAGKLRALGWVPLVGLDEALAEVWAWAVEQQEAANEGGAKFERALNEAMRGGVLHLGGASVDASERVLSSGRAVETCPHPSGDDGDAS